MMIEYCVYNTETGRRLFSSSNVSVCRAFARFYSKENCTPCTVSVLLHDECYVNGQKTDVQ